MRKTILLFTAVLTLAISCSEPQEETMDQLIDRVFAVAAEQSRIMSSALADDQTPKTFEDGKLVKAPYDWWCSGFFPGVLWYIYEYNGDVSIKELAIKETAKVEPVKYVTDHHDVGFMINCCYGHQYRLTGDEHALEVLRTAAQSLTGAFTEEVGCIKSWPFVKPGFSWVYPVIIDNMMNLELLLKAVQLGGEEYLKDVALTHARTTMKNHYREDYSIKHILDYNPETGEVIKVYSGQGYAEDSAWARGQAWGLYAFPMMYRMTGEQEFLDHALKQAEYLLPRIPEDGIPYWDYDSPEIPNDVRDASAAALVACALIELSHFVDEQKSAYFLSFAEKILRELASDKYLVPEGQKYGFLLDHSTGNKPGNSEVDVPLTYADYYFLEALMRWRALSK